MDDDHHDRRFSPPSAPPLFLGFNNGAFFSHGQIGEEEEWWGESADDVKQALLYRAVELESKHIAAQEKILRMECEMVRLRELVGAVTRERDEAREQAHHALVLLDRGPSLLFFQNGDSGGGAPVVTPRTPPNSGHAAGAQLPSLDVVEANHGANSGGGLEVSPSSSSLSSEESSVVVSSPAAMPAAAPAGEVELFELVPVGKLPEKGRLLEAVMKAGPLLQNLMLAGPLPQWRHPPPPLRSFEIPPVSISINSAAATAKATITAPPPPPTLAEDMKPSFAHHHGLCNDRKRGMEEEEDGELVAVAEPCGESPPSSSSSSPKISSGSSNTRSSCKYQKIGPFLRF